MATWSKSDLTTSVLKHLGVLAAGQTASAEDSSDVGAAIDSAHAELRTYGLVPFATSAIPEWAQIGMRDYVSAIIGSTFGRPHDPIALRIAKQRLREQMRGKSHQLYTEIKDF